MNKSELFVLTHYIKKVKNNLDKTKTVFVHIPKTGGTTVYNLIKNEIDITYIHIKGEYSAFFYFLDYILENPDIKLIMSWRHPIKHVLSVFNFFQKFDNYDIPTNFDEFLSKYNNIQVKYLTEEIFLKDNQKISPTNFEKITKLIARDNTLVLLTDRLEDGIKRLNTFLNIDIEYYGKTFMFNFDKIPVKITKEIEINILQNNKVDLEIYKIIVKKYNYEKTNSRLMVDVEDIPYYFPYNWFNSNKNKEEMEVLEEHLKTIKNNIINDRTTISIKEYIDEWLKTYPQFNNKYSEIEYYIC